MNHFYRSCVLTMVSLFCSFLFATGQTGSITGQITDHASGETLIGVNVIVEGTNVGTSTDLDGKYQLELEPGVYNILLSYISYTPMRIEDVKVTAGQSTMLNFPMNQAVFELKGEVLVTANRIDNTANALLSLQKQANGVQDGISRQEMSQMGTSDAAASLQKVTGISAVDGKYIVVRGLGDRYSTAQLNGLSIASADPYRNSTQMDMIPTNLLDNIVITKTFTPDQPGNFTGGNVQIKTKSLPESFTLSFTSSLGYNSNASLNGDFFTSESGPADWLGYYNRTRALPEVLTDPATLALLDRNLPILASKDAELAYLLDETSKSVSTQMSPSTKTALLNHGFSFSMGDRGNFLGKPLGFLFGVNYKRDFDFYDGGIQAAWELTESGAEGLNNTYLFNDIRGVERPSLSGMLQLTSQFSPNDEISLNLLYNHDAQHLSRLQTGSYPGVLSNSKAGFETRTLHFQERELSSVQLKGKHNFSELNAIRLEWIGGYTRATQLEPDLRFFANAVVDNQEYSINPAEYDLPYHFWRELQDETFQAQVDLTIPFLQDRSKSNKMQFGGRFSQKTRNFHEDRFQFASRDGLTYDGNPIEYFGAENTGIIDYDEDRDKFIFGNYLTNESVETNNYTGNETVFAGYGMITYLLTERLKSTAGVRMESTDLNAISQGNSLDDGFISQLDFLPSLNFSYALSELMNLRLSLTQTLARPNMREIAPFVSFDQIGGDLVRGNPELERTLIRNIDLRWEWYSKPGELFAISAYGKQFIDPIVEVYVPSAANPERTWQNVDQAIVAGVELEIRKNLAFIAPAFKHLNFSGNVSYIYSRVDVNPVEYAQNIALNPELKSWRPFQGQSPVLANANLFYQSDSLGLEMIVGFNFFGDRLSSVSLQGTPDIYELSRPSLNMRIRKELGERFSVTLSADNLLNASYQKAMTYREQEFVIQQYKVGRTFNLGFSYTIN